MKKLLIFSMLFVFLGVGQVWACDYCKDGGSFRRASKGLRILILKNHIDKLQDRIEALEKKNELQYYRIYDKNGLRIGSGAYDPTSKFKPNLRPGDFIVLLPKNPKLSDMSLSDATIPSGMIEDAREPTIKWLGAPVIGVERDQRPGEVFWEGDRTIYKGKVIDRWTFPKYRIGLRSDGAVVWRKKP